MRSVSKLYFLWAALFCCQGLIFTTTAVVMLYGNGAKVAPTLAGIIGVVFLLLGIYILSRYWLMESTKRRLIAQGKYVYAKIIGFQLDSFLSEKTRPVYQIMCSYKDPVTGEEHLFHSGSTVLSSYKSIVTKTVRVYTNPEKNFRDYYVDVTSCISVQGED